MNNKYCQTVGGLVLISMGVAAFLAFSGVRILGLSPWLLWGLGLPILWGLGMAYQRLLENGGRIDGPFLRQNVWLLLPLVIAVFFILDLNWSYLGSVIFIGAGLSMLLGQTREKQA